MEEFQQLKGQSGQSSLEFMLIIALTLIIIVPTTYLFYSYSKESSQGISDAQISKVGRDIIDTAESIYYSGQGSKAVLELNVPEQISGASVIDGRELVFNITTSFGVSEIVFFSSVNLTTTTNPNCIANVCKLPELSSPGLKKLKIEAVSNDNINLSAI